MYLKPRGKQCGSRSMFFFFFFRFSLAGKDTFSINNRFMRWSEEERTWGGVQSFWLEIREEEWPIERITNERDSPHQRRACSSVWRCCGAVSWYYGLRAELYGTRAAITTGGFEIHRSTTSPTLSTLGKEKGQIRSYLRLTANAILMLTIMIAVLHIGRPLDALAYFCNTH